MFFIKKHISIKQEKYYLNAKFNAKAYAIFEKKIARHPWQSLHTVGY